MTHSQAADLWVESSERNLKIAHDLMKLKHYDWALYMGQLVLEKILKGLYEKRANHVPPYIHDLVKLAKLANLKLTKSHEENLAEISTFHVVARYENIKNQLYKKATKDYANNFMAIIEMFSIWFKKLY